MSGSPAVFLDRDGTLIEERHYPTDVRDIVPVPGAGAALARLAQAGWLRVVLTNQSAVARGKLTEEDLGRLHDHMTRELAGQGGTVDAIYYCPHLPRGKALSYAFACSCRKPERGLLDLALAGHDIDLARSAFIGDKPRDLFPGVEGVGARILIVAPGEAVPRDLPVEPDHIAPDLPAAVDWLLDRDGSLRARGA